MFARTACSAAIVAFGIICSAPPVHAQQPAKVDAAAAQAFADEIAGQVAAVRGLPFKRPVIAETQSLEDFGKYVSRTIAETVPESLSRNYGTVVRTLGLYRGPVIEDFSSMMNAVMSSQVAAYYDPERQRFFVLMSMPEMMQGVMYAHEICHALQDQYFNLAHYMGMDSGSAARSRNDDSALARQAVVEGEATYVMTLWMMKKMAGRIPPRDVLSTVIDMQANLSVEQIREELAKPEVAKIVGSDLQDAAQATNDIPPFIIDTMIGAYLQGMRFIFSLQGEDWTVVEKLYTEYPPESTEQILHPEQWWVRDAPVAFTWPDFGKVAALRGWELLDENVLGEFQWRIVFREYEQAAQAASAAAGWGGDRYAVFRRKDADATLLLLRTAWDSEADAKEFVDVYQRVLAVKHADAPMPTRVVREGVDVFVVEGADERTIDSLVKVVRKAKSSRKRS